MTLELGNVNRKLSVVTSRSIQMTSQEDPGSKSDRQVRGISKSAGHHYRKGCSALHPSALGLQGSDLDLCVLQQSRGPPPQLSSKLFLKHTFSPLKIPPLGSVIKAPQASSRNQRPLRHRAGLA